MKKIKIKKSAKKTSKNVEKKDTLQKLLVVTVLLAVLLSLALFYNLSTVGQAITKPSPPVDLTLQSSEDLDVLAYNKMDVKIAFSGEEEISELTIDTTLLDEFVYYRLVLEDPDSGEEVVVAFGILGDELDSSGNIYLNDDNVGDLELSLEGDLLSVTNLNFIEPDIADFEIYDNDFIKIDDDVLENELGEESLFYINVTSTSLPVVSVMIDDLAVAVEEVDSGNDFVLIKVNFTGDEERPYSLAVTANVGGEETVKDFILAVDGYVYELIEEGYMVRLRKDGNNYEAMYDLEKTSELQPLSLLCGELDFADNMEFSEGIEKILSYDDNVEQWKENVPSEFEKLEKGKGYLIELKEEMLTFTVECNGKPIPETAILNVGWNLIGTNGYKATNVEDLEASSGEIVGIYEYNSNEALDLDKLQPGMVYWIKVETE